MHVVAYANRLPVSRSRQGWRLSAGGLVSALGPALESRGGAWVGWDGGADDIPRRAEGLDVELLPVALSRREVEDYYHGFANRTLWPLQHGLIEQPVFARRWWTAYRDVNERFAAVQARGGGLRWVHDYHLMLVPSLLRRAQTGPIGFFLHGESLILRGAGNRAVEIVRARPSFLNAAEERGSDEIRRGTPRWVCPTPPAVPPLLGAAVWLRRREAVIFEARARRRPLPPREVAPVLGGELA